MTAQSTGPRGRQDLEPQDIAFVPACSESDLAEGDRRCLKLGKAKKSVLLCRSAKGIHAIEPWCSHAWQELEGGIVRDGWIACPAHGARFDLATGEVLGPPATDPIATYPVRLRDGMIEVGIAA